MHAFNHLLPHILQRYALSYDGTHGIRHWRRVLLNGLRIAEENGADQEVVVLFALFHDSQRINEHIDHGHGLRGGDFAATFQDSLIQLSSHQFELLHEACRLHTKGLISEDATLGACWDADRLDLGRVGIRPNPKRLCTAVAQELIPWAHARAKVHYDPQDVLSIPINAKL